MNLKKYLIALILIIPGIINAQQISNVDFNMSGNIIIVEYNLTGAKFNQKFNVELYVSMDDGKTFQGPLKAVSGNVGENIKAGKRKIYWDPYKDVNSLEGDVVFDVRAEVIKQKVKKHFFVHYTGNYSLRNSANTAPIGLSIGQIGKVGWYVSARLNTTAFQSAEYDFNGTNVIDYDKVLYYDYDNEYKYPSLETFAGITAQIHWNVFLYGGVGYGYQKFYWHMNEYDYMDNSLQSDSYLDYTDYSVSGITAEAGMIIKAKAVSFNLGMSSLNFKYANIVFGIGLNF